MLVVDALGKGSGIALAVLTIAGEGGGVSKNPTPTQIEGIRRSLWEVDEESRQAKRQGKQQSVKALYELEAVGEATIVASGGKFETVVGGYPAKVSATYVKPRYSSQRRHKLWSICSSVGLSRGFYNQYHAGEQSLSPSAMIAFFGPYQSGQ